MIGSTAAFLLFLLGGHVRGFPLDRPQVSCEGQVRRHDHFLSRSHLDDLIDCQIQFRQNQVNLFWENFICFTFKLTEYETYEMSSSHSPTLRMIRPSLGSARSRICSESSPSNAERDRQEVRQQDGTVHPGSFQNKTSCTDSTRKTEILTTNTEN